MSHRRVLTLCAGFVAIAGCTTHRTRVDTTTTTTTTAQDTAPSAATGTTVEPTAPGVVRTVTVRSSAVPERREYPVSYDIDPCEDFWAHACDAVNDTFELRPDRSRHIFSMSDSAERLLDRKMSYLRDLAGSTPQSERAAEIRDYYMACMAADAQAQEERERVARVVRQVNDLPDRAALQHFLGERIAHADYSFLTFGTGANPDDADWLDAYFGADLMSLPERSYYDKPEVVAGLIEVMQSFFTIAGLEDAAARATQVVELERRFAQEYPLPAEWRELMVKKEWITRSDLLARFPNLRFDAVLDRIPARAQIRSFTTSYLEFLNGALATESLDVLKSAYLFHALSPIMDDAYPEFYDKVFAFRHTHLGGPPQRATRPERCAERVMGHLRQELDAELVDVFFPGFDAERFEALVNRVRAAMIRRLQANTWLSDAGRAAAVRKMENVSMMLVKPRNDSDWNFNLPADYDPARPLANADLHRHKGIELMMQRLAEPRNKNLWGMGPMTVNAYYSPSNNQFVMPVGILQYPFYDPELADYVNLGAVGAVVGHELGHAIDDKGSMFDEKGALNQWMTGADLESFKGRTAKIVDQFERACYHTTEGQPACHNGRLTLGENIGDLTGVSFAFEAVDFSDDPQFAREQKQAFFLQYARVWCSTMRDQEMLRRLKVDPHSLPKARVNEIVKHHHGFYEAFGCEAGDAMYLPAEQRVAPW